MPYSGLESLAAQTPIIGAHIGGIPELVEEGRTGFTFESGNAVDLRDVLMRAVDVRQGEYQRMQHACLEYVRQRCLQMDYVKQLDTQYADLIKDGE